jgi:hypothetical protein
MKLMPENYGDGTDFVYHTKSGVMAEASHGYLEVGEPLKALSFKGDITRQIKQDQNNRLHAWIPLDWARAYLMLGEVEESVKEATEFYKRALAMLAPHAIRRAYSFADELVASGYGDVRVVMDFRELLGD